MLLITFNAAYAQDTIIVADVTPAALPQDLVEIRLQPAIGPTDMPIAPGQQKLTPALLANYLARQKSLQAFNAFGVEPEPELTTELLSSYISRASFGMPSNGALGAIDSFTKPAEPALTTDVLARYVDHGFMPLAQRVKRAGSERDCLTQAIYHEARGETEDGQWAVANVIVNRAMSKRFPSTLCGVIYQNADKGKYRCQFTFACDGRPEVNRERKAWSRAQGIARAVYADFAAGKPIGIVPKSALFYHTTAVAPSWSHVYARVAQIGSHVFYSPN